MSYVELHTASAFSFLEAASLPEALVDRAAELGYPAVALLDRNGVHGAPRFHKAAKAAGLKADRRGGADNRQWQWLVASDHSRQPLHRHQPLATDVSASPSSSSRSRATRICAGSITRMNLRAPKGEGMLSLDEFDGHTGGARGAGRARGAAAAGATAWAA